jgi:hypothetical protein
MLQKPPQSQPDSDSPEMSENLTQDERKPTAQVLCLLIEGVLCEWDKAVMTLSDNGTPDSGFGIEIAVE